MLRLLKAFCPEQLLESIEGDLHEQYEINVGRKSQFKSNWLFFYNCIRFFRLGILNRNVLRQRFNQTAMLQNYFRISVRSLLKNRFFFSLNVLGLSIGIAACLICYLHVQYELSYDGYHKNSQNIYRIVTGDVKGGNGWVKVSTPIPPALKKDIPEIEAYARLTNITSDPQVTVEYNQKIFSEDKFFLADPALIKIFDFELMSGNKDAVLSDLNSVIISESMAKKYFGNSNPIGEQLKVDAQFDFIVSGIFKDVPFNSHFDFDFLVSFENLERVKPGTSLTSNWGQFNYYAYLQLTDGADPASVTNKIQNTEINIGDNNNFDLTEINIQPLSVIHFEDNPGNQKAAYNFKYIYIYGAIALAILFISFINFVNLSIAGSTKRLKEVGVRKVVGALKGQLVAQFVVESLLIVFFALLISLVIANYIFVPAVNTLMESQMALHLSDPLLIGFLLALLIIISFSSGSYIAYFVVSSNPIMALKGGIKTAKGKSFKNILLGLQFLISTVLIVSSVFIYQQLGFMKNKNLGFDKDLVLNISLNNQEAQGNGSLLKSELNKISGVKSVAASSFIPGGANWNQTVWWEGQEEPISMFLISVDEDFIETVGLELIEGDLDFIKNNSGDQKVKYILNESARKLIGWETALGKNFNAYGQNSGTPIAGVVKDYNFRSLHHAVAPCILTIVKGRDQNQLAVKITGDLPSTMQDIESAFHSVLPQMDFEYAFMDVQFDKLYKAELRTSKIVAALTVVAIVLAVLGLYALLTYAIQERTKELAIRKVLGIKMKGTLFLLSNNYVRIMVVANVLAIPLTYYMLNGWLDNFSYRISLNPLTFALIIGLSFAFIFIISGLKTFQTERINPTNALRND
jgi:putative ABC transport system permease protein